MGQQDVDAAQPLAGLDLLPYEVAALIRQLGRFRAALLRMRQILGWRVVPGRRERSSEAGHPQDLACGRCHLDHGPVRNVSEIRRQIAGRDRVEVVVIAVNPVERGGERLIAARVGRDVADAQPERNLRVPPDNRPRGVERAVNVSEDAEGYRDDAGRVVDVAVVPGAGTSRSVLSQMKSLLL